MKRRQGIWFILSLCVARTAWCQDAGTDAADGLVEKLQQDKLELEGHLRDIKSELQQQLSSAAQFSKELQDKLAKTAEEAAVAVQENQRLKEKLGELEKAVVDAKQALQTVKVDYNAAVASLEATKELLEKSKSNEAAALAQKQQADLEVKNKLKEAEDLLQLVHDAWLPLWAHGKYNETIEAIRPYMDSLRPTMEGAIKTGRQLSKQGSANFVRAIDLAQVKSKEAWEVAHPHIASAKAVLQDSFDKGLHAVNSIIGKSFPSFWLTVKETINKGLSSPQVVEIKEQALRVQMELEDFAISHLKKYPALASYANRPTVTYFLWALLLAPFVAILPLFFLGKPGSTSSDAPVSMAAAVSASAAPQAKGENPPPSAKAGKKKGRRITEGSDTIVVP
eukprot:jgi/Botrbrau1/11054/Bobra.0302s0001.1